MGLSFWVQPYPTLSVKLHSAETGDGGKGDWDRDNTHPITRHCTINMILNLLFWGGGELHNVALISETISSFSTATIKNKTKTKYYKTFTKETAL